jgi:cobalt/nickel transport system permease protein
MHIPDGFLATPVWAGLAAVSAPSVGVLSRRAQAALDESRIPLMGVMGAFVFAAQMINFPVGIGASGHLVGGALLAISLGPAPAAIVMTAILAIQALVFQDGGLLALGANVFNMALAGVLAAWLPYRLFADSRARSLGVFLAGFLSVFVSACLCLGQLALSGVHMPAHVLGLALAVFSVTAALEGIITVAVLGALEKIHPGWRGQDPARGRRVLLLLALAAFLLAVAGFLLASALPDGLERVAGLVGLEGKEEATLPSPLPGYEALMISNPWLSKAGAGLIGLLVTLLACLGIGRLISRWRSA